MIPHDLEKAWAARALQGQIYRAPTFVGNRLMLGAQTEIAVARSPIFAAHSKSEAKATRCSLLRISRWLDIGPCETRRSRRNAYSSATA